METREHDTASGGAVTGRGQSRPRRRSVPARNGKGPFLEQRWGAVDAGPAIPFPDPGEQDREVQRHTVVRGDFGGCFHDARFWKRMVSAGIVTGKSGRHRRRQHR